MTQLQRRLSKGLVGVETFQGRLRLRLPRQVYGGKQKYLTLGLDDSPGNRKIAQAKAKQIESDIALERFDHTLNKYRPEHAKLVECLQTLTVSNLWEHYVQYKIPISSPKTILDSYVPIGRHLANAPQSIDEPLRIRQYLLDATTEHMARRCLMHLSAACRWGCKNGLVQGNPFEGMYLELSKPRYKQEEQANPFSIEERDQIINAFQTHNAGKKGISYSYYSDFVKFLFYVGCRPSEAVGLRWKHINDDCSRITFCEAIVRAGGKPLARETTKTKKSRTFPCVNTVQMCLLSVRPIRYSPEDLVFPNRTGKPINYNDFSRRAWKTVTRSVNLHEKNGMSTTPYNCRDTFITLQALQGNSSDTIARWVGNTAEVIRNHYISKLALEHIKPTDV